MGDYPCVGRSNNDTRVTNGSGWVKADLESNQLGPKMAQDGGNEADKYRRGL